MLYLIGLLAVAFFSKRLFESSLMKQMYHTKFFRGKNKDKKIAGLSEMEKKPS